MNKSLSEKVENCLIENGFLNTEGTGDSLSELGQVIYQLSNEITQSKENFRAINQTLYQDVKHCLEISKILGVGYPSVYLQELSRVLLQLLKEKLSDDIGNKLEKKDRFTFVFNDRAFDDHWSEPYIVKIKTNEPVRVEDLSREITQAIEKINDSDEGMFCSTEGIRQILAEVAMVADVQISQLENTFEFGN